LLRILGLIRTCLHAGCISSMKRKKMKYGGIQIYSVTPTQTPDKKEDKVSNSINPTLKPKPDRDTPALSLSEHGKRQNTSAIFDLKWCPFPVGSHNHVLLAQATEDGYLGIYRMKSKTSAPALTPERRSGKIQAETESNVETESNGETETESKTEGETESGSPLELLTNQEVVKGGKPCLSLDWSGSPNSYKVMVSQGDAHVSIWSLDVGRGQVSETARWLAHEIDEVWICAFDLKSNHVVYTGGDDCTLKTWDTRSTKKPNVTCGVHDAGVTVISPCPTRENVIATGSYDEKIRLFDSRNMYRPMHVYESGGGGIWRIRWQPEHSGVKGPDRILAACMRAGFQVVALDENNLKMGLVAQYKDHTAPGVTPLAYGCDWGKMDRNLIASCSFYDKQLHLWHSLTV